MRVVCACMCLHHLVLGIFSHVATLHFNHLHLQFNIAFPRIHFFSHPAIALQSIFNLNFQFVEMDSRTHIWLLPKNYPQLSHACNRCVSNRKSNINAIKQWQYRSIAIYKWNWNLYVEYSSHTHVGYPCERMRANGPAVAQSDKTRDYWKWKHINNAFITSNIFNIFLITRGATKTDEFFATCMCIDQWNE